jgi:hypothetical protein
LALVKEREIAFFLQADKKIVPAISGTRKDLIRIKVWLIEFINEKLKKFDDVKNLSVFFLPAFVEVSAEQSVKPIHKGARLYWK